MNCVHPSKWFIARVWSNNELPTGDNIQLVEKFESRLSNNKFRNKLGYAWRYAKPLTDEELGELNLKRIMK